MKGKYAAKAANRAASVDNDVIVELREQLAQVRGENRRLSNELSTLNRSTMSAAMREAKRLADDEIERLNSELAEERTRAQEHLRALAFDLLDLYHEHGCTTGEDGNSEEFNLEFARLFGLSDRYDELYDYIGELTGRNRDDGGHTAGGIQMNRFERRMTSTAKKVRRVNSMTRDMRYGKGAVPTGRGFGRAYGTWTREGELPR
jgi:predicted RNase H-like nuclease (RuvC/YqgF family)